MATSLPNCVWQGAQYKDWVLDMGFFEVGWRKRSWADTRTVAIADEHNLLYVSPLLNEDSVNRNSKQTEVEHNL